MKKNSRIVTMAAAALLAVAPVAAGVVPGATTVNTVKADKKSAQEELSFSTLSTNATNNVKGLDLNKMVKSVTLSSGSITGASDFVLSSDSVHNNSVSELVGGKTYYVQATVDITGLAHSTTYTYKWPNDSKTQSFKSNSRGNAYSVRIVVPLHVYNPDAAGIPQFIWNKNGAVLNDGAYAPSADGIQVKNKETIGQILKAAKESVTFRDTMDNAVNNNQITTTASDVISELKQQGVTVNGSGANATVSATNGFNVTLTGKTLTNGKTATVKIPFVPAGAVVTDAPVINVATKPLGQASFGTATEASKGNQYYQVASGSNFNPLDFTTSNGTEVKFSATQSSKNNAAATLTATSNPVNTSEPGKFYHVTLTATNNGQKTSTYSYTVLVVSNGLQELYADAKTYNIYGDNVQATGQTIAKGTKVYVGNDTKTINKVSYSKISTKSKADADAGNLWIETSALAKPAGDTNTETHTIMVNSKAYDKNGNYLGHMYYAYNNIDIVPEVVTINGKTYYKVANKDEYVRVTNITGTKRTLRHNAYIYWSSYRRTPGTGKYYKGQTVTTYGGQMRFKNGKRYYRIEGCRNNNKRYIKAVNFY